MKCNIILPWDLMQDPTPSHALTSALIVHKKSGGHFHLLFLALFLHPFISKRLYSRCETLLCMIAIHIKTWSTKIMLGASVQT